MPTRSTLKGLLKTSGSVRWEVSIGLIDYAQAVTRMEEEVKSIANGTPELIWLVEHPPIYTAGTSANLIDLIEPARFPVHVTGRGGQYTYHGPGQRVVYVMLDLMQRGNDVRAFIAGLENVIIATLVEFGIVGERREDRVGVWVTTQGREDKIAAIGIRIRKGISFHGLSININPNLEHFSGIVPCGVQEHGITSFVHLGAHIEMKSIDAALKKSFSHYFGISDFYE